MNVGKLTVASLLVVCVALGFADVVFDPPLPSASAQTTSASTAMEHPGTTYIMTYTTDGKTVTTTKTYAPGQMMMTGPSGPPAVEISPVYQLVQVVVVLLLVLVMLSAVHLLRRRQSCAE